MSEFDSANKLIEAWDRGHLIRSIELGGLGPGYEQVIQVMAVEFARAALPLGDAVKDGSAFDALCASVLTPIDDKLGGVSGAQYGQAKWLAWQWCFAGPCDLIDRANKEGVKTILVSNFWPGVTQ